MDNTKEKYGETPENLVDPVVLKEARATLEFCLKNYGLRPGLEKPGLKWLQRSAVFYHLSRIEEAIGRLAGQPPPDALERSYLETEPIYGVVPSRWTHPDKPGPIFISSETPLERIRGVVGHEFFHWRYSGVAVTPAQKEQDEKAAWRFSERIEAEMAAEKAKEDHEQWMKRYRELNSRR